MSFPSIERSGYCDPFFLTIEEVAARLGVGTPAVRARMRTRRGTFEHCARRIGRRLRFSPEIFATPLAMRG